MEALRFDELDLYPQILRAIQEMGFEEATPIQCKAIPVVMEGVDVIGQAQTGTGKTAAPKSKTGTAAAGGNVSNLKIPNVAPIEPKIPTSTVQKKDIQIPDFLKR